MNVKLFVVLLALIRLVFLDTVHAAAIGMPESTARFGYALGLTQLSIDDPDGPTDSTTDVRRATLM